MTRTAEPRRSRRLGSASRKAELIDATLRCLREYGFEGTSIRRISAAAGVSVGLINHHFAGKEELVADAYLAITARITSKLREAIDESAADGRRRLTAFFGTSFSPEMLGPEILEAWLAFWGGIKNAAPISHAHEKSYGEYRATLADALTQLATERGWKDFDAGLAAIGLSALLDGLWLEYSLNPRTFTPAQGVGICEAWVDGLEAGGYRGFRVARGSPAESRIG